MALDYSRPDDIPVTIPTIMQDIIDDNPLDVSQGIIRHGEGVDLLPSNILSFALNGLEVSGVIINNTCKLLSGFED